MATVREATYDLLRSLGMRTFFGNPGSTEIPFLNNFPDDFTYILALQEASALGMADGYAQGTGRPALVNLHTAPGLGNAMGALVTAYHNGAPLVVTAGQQDRRHIAREPLLSGSLTELAKPYVIRSAEPLRAEDVPGGLLRAYHTALQPPRGPVFVSIPMDDWEAEATEELHPEREVIDRPAPDAATLRRLAEEIGSGRRPGVVAGSGVDRAGAYHDVVDLAERLGAEVWQDPIPNHAGFPQSHPLFRGRLAPSRPQLADQLSENDLVLVLGAAVFLYYPYMPGPTVREGTRVIQITDDPEEAARATLGTSVVGDVGAAVRELANALPERQKTNSVREKPEEPEKSEPISVAYAMHTLSQALPEDAILPDESISSSTQLHRYVRLNRPGSYYHTASGGLGFAMPAAVGLKLASPERPVVCAIGDGSAMYSVQALWSAARYGVAVVFYVIDNSGYSILKGFRDALGAEDVPGLDLPGVDLVSVAKGLGCAAENVTGPDELPGAIKRALGAGEPYVLNVAVDPTPPPLLG